MYGEKSKGEVLKVQFGMQRVRASTQKATRGRDERVTERPECLGKDFECEIERPNIWKEFLVSVNPLLDLLVILASPRATFRTLLLSRQGLDRSRCGFCATQAVVWVVECCARLAF